MKNVEKIEEDMLEEAKKKAERIAHQAEEKAEKALQQAEERAQKIEDQRLQKMEVIQNRLLAREEKMDEKLERLEEEKSKLNEKQKELEEAIVQQMTKLSEVAGLSKEQAKELLFQNVEKEYQKDMEIFIEKLKTIKKEEADKESAMIVARALPRVAVDSVSEFTTKTVDLPNEDFK